jgi:cytochrome c oxidase subunit 2
MKRGMQSVVFWIMNVGILFADDSRNPWQVNMYRGVTPISHDMYDLHMIALIICAVIGVVVFGVMLYALIHHRKAAGHKAARFHDNFKLEVVWTIIPFLILVALAIPATRVLIHMDDTKRADVTVKVTGSQWKWHYEYMDEGIAFYSQLATPFDQLQNTATKNKWYLLEVDKPLIVPIHKKIRFLVTSADVNHSWWVPELGIKRDAIPGFVYESWARIEKPGTYRGQCAELCGVYHGFMPIVVKAVPEAEYAAWVASQKAVKKTPNETMTRQALLKIGKEQYDKLCSACHQPNGDGIPPLYPALKRSSVALGHPIERHIDIVLHGIPGTAMQAYRDVLSDREVAAIVTYERNAWGNNTDELVMPEMVAKERHI